MSILSWLGNLLHGGENYVNQHVVQPIRHDVQNVVHTAQQAPQAVQRVVQQAPRVIPHVAPPPIHFFVPHVQLPHFQAPQIHPQQFVHPIVHEAQNIAHTHIGPFTVGQAANELINKPFIQPAIHAGEDIGNVAIAHGAFGKGLQPYAKHVDTRQAIGDIGTTALNALTAGQGGKLIEGANLGAKVAKGAKAGAAYGGAFNALQSVHDHQSLPQIFANTAIGSVGGAALGAGGEAAIHGAGVAGKAIANELKAGLPHAQNEGGYWAPYEATNFKKYVKQGKPLVTFPDGHQAVAISDQKMKIKPEATQALANGHEVHLDDLVHNPQQKKDLPILYSKEGTGAVKVLLDATNPDTRAFVDPSTNTIHVNPEVLGWKRGTQINGATRGRIAQALTSENGRKILSHEISHAIDEHANVPGSNPTDVINTLRMQLGRHPTPHEIWQAYNSTPSEQRALYAEDHLNKSQKELDQNTPVFQQPFNAPKTPEGALAALKDPDEPVIAENKFTQSVKNSPEASSEVRGMVSGQHEVRNTQDLIDRVRGQITANPQGALDQTLNELSTEPGKASDETLARAIELAKDHDAIGTPEAQNLAASLYDQVSEHGVAKGQGSQILSMLARRSPAGLRNKAFKDLKKAGIDLTPEIKKEIQGHIDAIKSLPEGESRDMAVAVLQKAVAKHIPSTKADSAISIWKAGLLSGVKTQQGNAISNATFGTLHKLSDPLSAVTDQVMSIGSGKRTKTMTGQGLLAGTKEGLGKGKNTLKTGIDPRNIGADKYEQYGEINMSNKTLQKYLGTPANYIFRGMSAADQPFYYSALKNSMYDQAKAEGINKGLSGSALNKFMQEAVQNPTDAMAKEATREAGKSVLAYDTVAAKLISLTHQEIDKLPRGLKPFAPFAKATLNIVAPFVRVPTAFLSRTVDFTPLGLSREIVEQAMTKNFDQRRLATAIGEGMTGTGAIVLGMALTGSGKLSGDYPKNDPKEAARWKAEGITPNSIKLGNKWWSLNYMGPLGLLFRAGQQMEQAKEGGANAPSQIAQAVGGLGQGLMGQSFLQGFSGLSNAIQDPQRSAPSFLNSEVGSLVPNIVNDISNLTDKYQRQTNNATQAVIARVPGLRQTLAVKTDSLGNDLKQPSGGGLWTLLGIKPSNSIDNPMFSEVNRLQKTGNLVFPVEDKTIGSGKDAVKLTPEQVTQRSKMVGQALTPLWNQIMQSPEYQKLDDAHKALALQKALTDVNSSVNRELLAKIDPSKLTSQANKKEAGIINHTATAQDYLTTSKPSSIKASVTATANKYGIPPSLFAALVKQESGGNQGAISGAGAIGLTQLMPATAKALGVDPNDPRQNLEGGAKYLAQQYAKYHDWGKALAAYNAGPGAVDAAGGVPNIPETQNYVKNILAMAKSLNPDTLKISNRKSKSSGGAVARSSSGGRKTVRVAKAKIVHPPKLKIAKLSKPKLFHSPKVALAKPKYAHIAKAKVAKKVTLQA